MDLKKINWTWWLENKPPSQQEIADFYNVDKSTVSKWVSSLERNNEKTNNSIKASLAMYVNHKLIS